jgi:hypothetical protein
MRRRRDARRPAVTPPSPKPLPVREADPAPSRSSAPRESLTERSVRPEAARSVLPSGRRLHALAASALMLVYLAVMSGHMTSMDGFLVQRQARALVFEHSINFRTPGWFWKGEPVYSSKFGIGLSLAYVPGMMFASPLVSLVPSSAERPKKTFDFYYKQLYEDPLYTVGASWVHAAVTALAAFFVARLMTALGCSRRASLWGVALYGIGSAALVYSRGDFTQPLVGMCWAAAMLAAVVCRQSGSPAAAWSAAGAVGFAVLTRPFDGLLLFVAVLALVTPLAPSKWNLRALGPAMAVVAGLAVATIVTGLLNQARTGDPWTTGYKLDGVWSLPDLERIAYVLVGPSRGLLWDFPAVLLLPLGMAALARHGKRFEAGVLLALCGALLLNTMCWKVWWGGWCWGLRLFVPALPLLAAVAGAGIDRLGRGAQRLVPAALLLAGLVCALPGTLTDPLAGFARMTDGDPLAWSLEVFPPVGAWKFVEQVFPKSPTDTWVVDNLWFRLAPGSGYWTLLVPVLLLAGAAALARWCVRELRAEERGASSAASSASSCAS